MASKVSPDIEKAHEIARSVVVAQSNLLIKELLRKKGYKGATNKEQIEEQLHDAIDSQNLTSADLTAWLEETEGWGNEHVYLYRVPDYRVDVLADPEKVKARLAKERRGHLWQADRSLEFPEARKLTGVYHDGEELMFVWHEGAGYRRRAIEKDFEEDDQDGEHYFYEAYRRIVQRDVTRVIVRRGLLAVFLPGDRAPATHAECRAELCDDIKTIVPFTAWDIYSMGEAIKTLDTASMRPSLAATLRAPKTRLKAKGGGYVDFSSETGGSYVAVDELREVRAAVRRSKFSGGNAQFTLSLPPLEGAQSPPSAKERTAKMHLYSDYDRIRFTSSLTRADVWWILRKIPKRRRP